MNASKWQLLETDILNYLKTGPKKAEEISFHLFTIAVTNHNTVMKAVYRLIDQGLVCQDGKNYEVIPW